MTKINRRLLILICVALGCLIYLFFMSEHFSFTSVIIQVFSNEVPLFDGNMTRRIVIWSNDYHISPINDLKYLLKPLGVIFIDKSLSGHCHITNTCQGRSTLKVINVGNAMNLPPSLIPAFYAAYKDDPQMRLVDAFVCFHPSSMCELFMPFNKSIIVIASTRYELGRFGQQRWTSWNENLKRIAASPQNVIAGNNMYDVEYIKYFTGLQPQLLYSFCDYISDKYTGSKPGYLIAPIHNAGFSTVFTSELMTAWRSMNCSVAIHHLRHLYSHYKYSDLAAHQGIIYVPYQVSVMSFFEQYRMNIPLFCPSKRLLAEWQLKYLVMTERTWDGTFGHRPNGSVIRPHPSQQHLPDPNNEFDQKAIEYWIQFADYYQWPHITYYDSIPDLLSKLESMSTEQLKNISEMMKVYNTKAKQDLLNKWKIILQRVAAHSSKTI